MISHEGPHQEGEVHPSSFLHFYKVIRFDFVFPLLRFITAQYCSYVRLKQKSTTETVLATLL